MSVTPNDAYSMFSIYCPRHGSEVLVGSSRIRRMVNTEHGILLDVECYCGQHVVGATGRRYARSNALALAS